MTELDRQQIDAAIAEGSARVSYRAHPSASREIGTLIRTNDLYAFVLFDGHGTPQAVRFADLELLG